MSHTVRLTIALLTLCAVTATAQAPQWCTTASLAGHLYQGCGVAASADESVRQAYGEVARLLESRVRVSARSLQGQSRADTKQRAPIYDTTSYEVRLQSDVSLHGLQQRQATTRGRVYTLVTFDAGPALDRLNGALFDANGALMRGELGSAVGACRRATSIVDSLPWLGGLAEVDLDCRNIRDVLDAGVRVEMIGASAARVTFQETPVVGVFLVSQRERAGVVRALGPSSSGGIVELPSTTAFGSARSVRELIDVDWDRSGVDVSLPFRQRATRTLRTSNVALSVALDGNDDRRVRQSAIAELQQQLGVPVDTAATATGDSTWRLSISGSWRDVAPIYGGEHVAGATLRWNVVDGRSGRVIGAGAVVDQRGRADDQSSARDTAMHLAVRRVVAELERLVGSR